MPALVFACWLLVAEHASPHALYAAAAITLAAIVVGGLLSLMLIYKLLAPLRLAADALDDYYREQKLTWLPAIGDDDMARLLRGINRCLRGVDAGLQQLARLASEDPLTHALNRRGCERALADSMTLASNGRMPFVLLVVDVDNLKPINDTHGHAAGDRALISLVTSARASCLGEQDWIGRWGGDEFLLGIHDELDTAKSRIQCWLDAMETAIDPGVPVHVSAGCAHYQPGLSLASLYRQADSAMYEAKFSGGHRLICSTGRARDSDPGPPARDRIIAERASPPPRARVA
jgi:diguanylate cyclase (GGDEF)-like protein